MTNPPPRTEWVMRALVAHEKALLRFAASYVGPELAHDLVQETFLELCKADQASIEDRLVPWLFCVCKNRAISARRAGRNRADDAEVSNMESTEESPHRVLEKKQDASEITAILDTLPEREREVVALKFSGGLSYKEIADVTGLSVSHVGVLLHEALGKVRAGLAKKERSLQGRRTA